MFASIIVSIPIIIAIVILSVLYCAIDRVVKYLKYVLWTVVLVGWVFFLSVVMQFHLGYESLEDLFFCESIFTIALSFFVMSFVYWLVVFIFWGIAQPVLWLNEALKPQSTPTQSANDKALNEIIENNEMRIERKRI